MLSQTVFQAAIILLGVLGLSVSTYLHYKKKTSVDSMACPMDGSCEQVITSKYSKFLGFDVEIIGMAYYLTVIVAYTIFLSTPQIAPAWFTFGVLLASISAVLFSTYLTYLQGVTLKMWCTWCLVSASLCAGILLLAVPAATTELSALMVQYSGFLSWVAVVAAAAGLGTALSYDTLLLSSLRDFELSETQAEMLNTLNHLTWGALAALVVSGIGLAIGDNSLLGEPVFVTSVMITGFLIAIDSVYSLSLSEKLVEVDYSEEKESNMRDYLTILACASVYSWASLLTVTLFEPSITLDLMVSLYLLGLVIMAISALILDKVIELRAANHLPDWSPLH